MLVELDMTDETNLKKLVEIPYRLEMEEEAMLVNPKVFLTILKMYNLYLLLIIV
jgi:hypothetical protein